MRTAIVLSLLLSTAGVLLGQAVAPSKIEWSRTFSAAGEERDTRIATMPDGGYILGCTSTSGVGGDKTTTNYGPSDFWVLRLDRWGSRIWEANLGGENSESLGDLKPTLDGGVILLGESFSPPSGNKTAPLIGDRDFWVVRLDAEGNKLWDKSFGGLFSDKAGAVEALEDGGFLVAGTRKSYAQGRFWSCFWVVRLDAQGEALWDRSYTNGITLLTAMQKAPDGGFVLAGEISQWLQPDRDIWIVRIDADGNILWDRTFGGTGDDDDCQVRALQEGGFILGALTTSDIGGNKTTPIQGNQDYWVLRLDADGNKVWEQDFGGTLLDWFGDVQQTLDGGFLAAGFGYSEADGNKTAPRRGDSYDLWVVRLDKTGTKVWDETYDGIHRLGPPRLQSTGDGGFAIAATFNTFTNIPIQDLILFKLSPDALTAPQLRVPVMNAGAGFRFELSGISNRTYVTEFSGDMVSWLPLATNQVTSGSVDVVDPTGNGARRFYRARMVE